ncbi:type VI secretion system protein ImpA [Comamonas sp. BIGb0152]|uniref:type VI secretion system protein TssA n=1 Tax=Comamonas sp. BIGb0152 TaxID=2940601 RepID=UPI002167D055|nr:type VI secretion system protein TssA [Comamonas sp. BIGb0152]MCS4292973.1 type VI secretion system protein ImpA [Comamonas sp. BIGb0152]
MEDFNIDLDWAAPVSEAQPAGKNTEFDTQYAELETAAIHSPEQQYGDTLIAAKEPDWPQVLALATALSAQTKDLRVLLWLTRALTRMHGLAGLHYGLQSVHTVCQLFWEQVHPQLDVDGDADPHMRYSVFCDFGDINALVADMRQSEVLPSHIGALTVKDLERLHDSGSIELNGIFVTTNQVAQILEEQRQAAGAPILDQLEGILDLVAQLQSRCREQLGSDYEPDLQALRRPLEKICKLMRSDDVAASGNAATQPSEAHALGAMAAMVGDLHSRKDAIRQLELVCRYLEQHEPSNPAPLLIRRAIKVMDMGFMDIVRHMAPDGLNQAMFITDAEPSDQ